MDNHFINEPTYSFQELQNFASDWLKKYGSSEQNQSSQQSKVNSSPSLEASRAARQNLGLQSQQTNLLKNIAPNLLSSLTSGKDKDAVALLLRSLLGAANPTMPTSTLDALAPGTSANATLPIAPGVTPTPIPSVIPATFVNASINPFDPKAKKAPKGSVLPPPPEEPNTVRDTNAPGQPSTIKTDYELVGPLTSTPNKPPIIKPATFTGQPQDVNMGPVSSTPAIDISGPTLTPAKPSPSDLNIPLSDIPTQPLTIPATLAAPPSQPLIVQDDIDRRNRLSDIAKKHARPFRPLQTNQTLTNVLEDSDPNTSITSNQNILQQIQSNNLNVTQNNAFNQSSKNLFGQFVADLVAPAAAHQAAVDYHSNLMFNDMQPEEAKKLFLATQSSLNIPAVSAQDQINASQKEYEDVIDQFEDAIDQLTNGNVAIDPNDIRELQGELVQNFLDTQLNQSSASLHASVLNSIVPGAQDNQGQLVSGVLPIAQTNPTLTPAGMTPVATAPIQPQPVIPPSPTMPPAMSAIPPPTPSVDNIHQVASVNTNGNVIDPDKIMNSLSSIQNVSPMSMADDLRNQVESILSAKQPSLDKLPVKRSRSPITSSIKRARVELEPMDISDNPAAISTQPSFQTPVSKAISNVDNKENDRYWIRANPNVFNRKYQNILDDYYKSFALDPYYRGRKTDLFDAILQDYYDNRSISQDTINMIDPDKTNGFAFNGILNAIRDINEMPDSNSEWNIKDQLNLLRKRLEPYEEEINIDNQFGTGGPVITSGLANGFTFETDSRGMLIQPNNFQNIKRISDPFNNTGPMDTDNFNISLKSSGLPTSTNPLPNTITQSAVAGTSTTNAISQADAIALVNASRLAGNNSTTILSKSPIPLDSDELSLQNTLQKIADKKVGNEDPVDKLTALLDSKFLPNAYVQKNNYAVQTSVPTAPATTTQNIPDNIIGRKARIRKAKGMLSKNIKNHAQNMVKLSQFIKENLMDDDMEFKDYTMADMLKDYLMVQPNIRNSPPEEKIAKGCNYCDSKTDLMVHDKDPDDYTCTECLRGKGMTKKRFTPRNASFIHIKDSNNEDHKKNHSIIQENDLIAFRKMNPVKTKYEIFHESYPFKDDMGWFKRLGKGYIMDRKIGAGSTLFKDKDTNRLAYMLGVAEHFPEKLNQYHKANLYTLMNNHMEQSGIDNDIDQTPELDKFDTFDEILGQLHSSPNFLNYIIL